MENNKTVAPINKVLTEYSEHAAVPSTLGYDYQFYYFVYRALRLNDDQTVLSFEKIDDVAEEQGDHITLYQLKHTIGARKNGKIDLISPRENNLWKTLIVWLKYIKAHDNEERQRTYINNTRFPMGINSPKILPAYLHWKEELHGSKLVYYKAKNKELGWRQLTTKLVFENGDVEYDKRDTNYFTHGFIATHAFARPSCYDCKFKGTPRIADITLGDFWGAEKYVGKELDNDLGTSVVIINSKKGLDFPANVNFRITA